MEQLQLPLPADINEPFTLADLDEWIAHVEACSYDSNGYNAAHYPNEWAREGLAALLGESVPFGRWVTKDLLALLRRARQA